MILHVKFVRNPNPTESLAVQSTNDHVETFVTDYADYCVSITDNII